MAFHPICTGLIGGAVALAASAAAAQDPPVRGLHEVPKVTIIQPPPEAAPRPAAPAAGAPTPVAPVAVQGPRTREELRKDSYSFVQAYAAPTAKIDQVARWHDGICIEVVGLSKDLHDRLVSRIQDVAKSVKLHMMRPGCSANLQIAFTPTPQALLDKIADRAELLLGFHYPGELQQVKTVKHPIQAWHATATSGGAPTVGLTWAGGDGGESVNAAPEAYGTAPGGPAAFGAVPGLNAQLDGLDTPDTPVPAGCANSPHFTACLTSRFAHVIVVADSKAVTGMDFGPVADYVTMLALSQPKSLDGCNALPSIMDLFAASGCAGRSPPDGLTPADMAYLAALYGADAQDKLRAAQSDMADRMARTLIKAELAR